jgi:hypothetical protein
MFETWLRPNRRAVLLGCVPPLILAMIGVWVALPGSDSPGGLLLWLGFALILISLGMIGLLVAQLRRPRIAFRDGNVLFYVRSGPPIGVPAQYVEAFFLGQGPAHLPGVSKQPETVNLVARISQRQTEWSRQEVKQALGNWCDGYVTIRGAWCEPLGTELVRKLNRRLKEVKDDLEATRRP